MDGTKFQSNNTNEGFKTRLHVDKWHGANFKAIIYNVLMLYYSSTPKKLIHGMIIDSQKKSLDKQEHHVSSRLEGKHFQKNVTKLNTTESKTKITFIRSSRLFVGGGGVGPANTEVQAPRHHVVFTGANSHRSKLEQRAYKLPFKSMNVNKAS